MRLCISLLECDTRKYASSPLAQVILIYKPLRHLKPVPNKNIPQIKSRCQYCTCICAAFVKANINSRCSLELMCSRLALSSTMSPPIVFFLVMPLVEFNSVSLNHVAWWVTRCSDRPDLCRFLSMDSISLVVLEAVWRTAFRGAHRWAIWMGGRAAVGTVDRSFVSSSRILVDFCSDTFAIVQMDADAVADISNFQLLAHGQDGLWEGGVEGEWRCCT